MSKQLKKVDECAPRVQRLPLAIPGHRLLFLVPYKSYGSEGLEPVDVAQCPYFKQHRSAVSCVSGSRGSLCGGFYGTTAEGETQCGWLPRMLLRGQTFVLFAEDAPDPVRVGGGGV